MVFGMAGDFERLTDEALRGYLQGAAILRNAELRIEDDGDEWIARFMVPTPLGGHVTDLSLNGADARQAMERLAILIAQDARLQLYG